MRCFKTISSIFRVPAFLSFRRLDCLIYLLLSLFTLMKKTPISETISFRLHTHLVDELRQKAGENGFSSHHFYARDLLLSTLAEVDLRDSLALLQNRLMDLTTDLAELRIDLRLQLIRLIVTLTDLSVEEAYQLMTADLSELASSDALSSLEN